MRSEKLTSAQNQKFRELLSLYEKPRERKEKGLFVVEGRRELEHCLNAGYTPRAIFCSTDMLSDDNAGKILSGIDLESKGTRIFEISRELYSKAAYRESTEGIIAEIFAGAHGLDSLSVKEAPLIAVIESVEKPGNVGAILRSADAAGVDAVIICDPKCDLYNPNIIRSSIGAVFTLQIAVCSTSEAIAWLKERNITVYTAQLQDSELYYKSDMTEGCAIVMGSEDKGLGNEWREAADRHIRIPMLGRLDSLNVSVSAAILLYEAVRQRQEKR